MFKVIENHETVEHASGNPELETEQVVFTLYHNGVAVATTDHHDAVDTMVSDYCYDNDIECDPFIYEGV